jgi:hypothetical protein
LARQAIEHDSGRLNRKEGFTSGSVSDSRCWLGLGASIEWQNPIRKTYGIGLSARLQAAARAGRQHRYLG